MNKGEKMKYLCYMGGHIIPIKGALRQDKMYTANH